MRSDEAGFRRPRLAHETVAPRSGAFRDYTGALVTLLLDAREDLDAGDYSEFVSLALDAVGHEGARLVVGEALRARSGRLAA